MKKILAYVWIWITNPFIKILNPFSYLYNYFYFRKLRKDWQKYLQNMPKRVSGPQEFLENEQLAYKELWNSFLSKNINIDEKQLIEVVKKYMEEIHKKQ